MAELAIDELRIAWNEADPDGEAGWSGHAVDFDGDRAAEPSALLLVFLDPPPEVEHEAEEWFRAEHLPRLLAVRGVLAAARFQSTRESGRPAWLIAYHLSDPSTVASAEWSAAADSEWTRRLRARWRQASRVLVTRA